jgi:hypothetical protein
MMMDKKTESQRGWAPGLRNIVRFNYDFYLTVLGLSVGLVVTLCCVNFPESWRWVRWLLMIGGGVMLWWTLASLIVSAWVYDVSDWPRGEWWRRRQLVGHWQRVLNIHTGFDETTVRLKSWSSSVQVTTLDLFDPETMTERSLQRARALFPPTEDCVVARGTEWPQACDEVEVACLLLALHEYRRPEERQAVFRRLYHTEAQVVLLAEHVRDGANFLAFGPGFFHFHSAASWKRDWEAGGWRLEHEEKITPFVRLWQLVKKEEIAV